MLILTKYKQAIIKVLFGLTNCLFFVWLKKIFSSKSKKILLYFIAIFGIISLLWQFHFKAVLSDVNPPYKNTAHPRQDAFPTRTLPLGFNADTSLETPLASETINIDRLGYKLTKLYYQNGVDYFRCVTNDLTKNDLQYYCDSSINKDDSLKSKDSQCSIAHIFCTEEQVFNFQSLKQESFYKRSPGEKIIRLVKEYKSGDTILTDYRISYLPPYDQFNLVPTASTGVPTASTGVLNVSSVGNPAVKIDPGLTPTSYTDYNGKASNLPACKAGASLQDIGNTCMLKIKIDDANKIKINAKDFDFAATNDYCHTKTKEAPVLGENCRLPSCLSIAKEYYRRPGINCLADCNDVAEFNGIDNANLRLPGINCLPACETGAKSVDYSSKQGSNLLLPKDIGVTCFLKHQNYVMPVCNSTPLANFSDDSNSQGINDIKTTVIANPKVPRKDCMNAADLPLCAFFSEVDRVVVANKFGCLGMVTQNTAGTPSFVDNKYVLGVYTINLSLPSKYDEDPGTETILKNIPIIDYTPSNCNDAAVTIIGCGKPYTYSKLAQAASSIASKVYPANVDMMQVQDASYNDVLNHDSVNENHASSLRVNPFNNTTRPTATPGSVFSVNTSGYKIIDTLAFYYNATNKPSCSLLTKQELKFIGTRNCDLNQIWSDTTGGKNSIPDLSSSASKNFCEGQYFCKVDTRCSMFSDEQLQEAKVFFHCLPAQYSKYEESKADIKCNILNDFEILALTKTTKSSSEVKIDELDNYINKACFRGNLAFLIHKRVDHNIANSTILGNTDNVPDYASIKSSLFDANVLTNTPSVEKICDYDNNRVNYMFPTGKPGDECGASVTAISSATGSCLSGKFACYHSSQFHCNFDSYKRACYLLQNYKFKNAGMFFNDQSTTRIIDINIASTVPDCSSISPDLKQNCVVRYGLNNLGTLNCFNDHANFDNTAISGVYDADKFAIINKCDANPLLSVIFVPNAKTSIVYDARTPLSYKPINDNNTDCYNCYCLPIDNDPAAKTRYIMGGGLAADFDSSVRSVCGAADSNCYICYKPNFYAGLVKKSTPSSPYYPIIENAITTLPSITPKGSQQELTSDMGYYQYEDPFYSWFFFPKPNTSGLDATQTVRDCGNNKKCYKAFTVDFPNSRGNIDVDKAGYLNNETDRQIYLDFFEYPPIYYYGNGRYGDDSEKEKYNLASSKEGLDAGIMNRLGLHSMNQVASPSATALRGSSMMGANPYGTYTYTSSFDGAWLCGMNRYNARLPDEDTFAYFAPVLVQSGRFGLKANNVKGDPRRFAFSDTKWNSLTKKLEYYVNICLRYESVYALGACGRRECRIDNPPGMMHCGEDQCRKFMVEQPEEDSIYSKCHLLAAMGDVDGKRQSHWFLNEIIIRFLKIELPSDYEKCVKLYSDGYTKHRVRAFYENGYVCAELDFYGIDLATYNKIKDDMNKIDANSSSFELPGGGKICYGGRTAIGKGQEKHCSFGEGSFNTFADLNSGIGGSPGAVDTTVWRTVRKIKFISNVSNDPNIEFLGYSVPKVANESTQYAYRTDTNVHNLFPAKMKAKDGLITMVYNHDARIRKIEESLGSSNEADIFASSKNDRDPPSETSPTNDAYGLLQRTRGKKNPYYGFNGYDNGNNTIYNWLSTSLPDSHSLCVMWGFIPLPPIGLRTCDDIPTSYLISLIPGISLISLIPGIPHIPHIPLSHADATLRREDGTGLIKTTTEALYRKNFQPNNFLQEKVWLKSDCVPVQKRVGFPLSSAVATPDNAPNLFAPEPMVFALKTTNPNNPWKKATEIHDVDKLDFSDPEIVLKYGEKYYYLQVPQKHASLTKCHSAPFNDDSNQRLKFTLKEMPNDRFRDDSDLIDKLNHNIFNSSKNEVSTTPSSTFESDTAFFKEHHNLNLSKSDCSGSDKPYGVVITSNLRQIIGGPSISQLHAQIFVKKEQKDSDPVLCVYRATMDNDKPAMTTDDKLTVIGCFSRKHPVVNNMKLSKAVSPDTSKNDFLNHEVTFEYKYSDVASYTVIAKMFKQLSDSTVTTTAHKYKLATNRDALKDALEDVIYFEGIQISSARHRCTALNLDCIDNEREIQKICDTEKLICNRSIVQTKDDFKGLNESINNNNFDIFVTQPLALDLYKKLEFREYCIQGLLNDCNILNGYTDSDIAKFPEIKTLHPKWNNRSWLTTAQAHLLSASAQDALGFNNMVCLKKGVINLIDQSPQFIVPKTIANDKGRRSSDPNNYEVCPADKSCRVAEIYEYKQGSPFNNVITGNNLLCVGIGGGTINAPKLVGFCEEKSYPLKNLKYKNFNINYANKINLIQQGNIRYQSLISKNSLTYSDETDSGENGVDKSHENRRGGVIITDNAKTANAELDVSFDGDTGMYGVCNGFWKNKNIDDAPRYSCTSTASQPLQLLGSDGSYSDACQPYSCPAIQYGNKISSSYENQAMQNGLYNQNGQVIGLDIAEKRGWASWQNFIKTKDFIENVLNTGQCLVGFAKNNIALDSSQCFDAISCASANTGNADASKMLTAICPTSSGSANCSDPDNNVYNNYCPTGATCLMPSTHCNQFGYWRFTWSEEFRKAYDKDGLTAGATVLNECQRIKCSITNLEDKFQEGSINKTPIRLIKPRCDGLNTMVAELNTRIVNLQDNKYYYLKTNNLGACANANTLRIVKAGSTYDSLVPATYDSISILGVTDTKKPLNSHSDHNKVTAWYFKITSTTPSSKALEIIPSNLHITTNSNKNTIDHEKILKVWSKIAGFQPDADTRTLIPAMRNKTIEHAKIGGEKQSTNNDDDDYDTTGKCLASLGYRKITPEINPQLLCNYQGILKIKEPCISTCDAVDNSMADTEIHGYSLWAETENKIKVCGDRCSPVTTKIPFSYIGKSTPQCFTGNKPYPYPPFRSLEGVKFKFMNNLIASVQVIYDPSSTKSKDIYDATACSSALNGCIVEFDKTNITENVKLLKNSTEYSLYKKDSLGGKEKFASYDILPNVQYQINQESSDYFVTLVQSIKLTDDNRWQEYNINKRKIFTVADCSISANSINCQCGSGSHPACPFDNVFDKISESEVVEIKLASSSSPVSLKFQQNTSYTNNIDIETISTASSHFVLQLKKDLSGNLQWKQLVGSYLGLERLANTTSVSMATCTQLTDSAVSLPSSDYNCNLNLNILADPPVVLRNNQEIKINFTTPVPNGGNPSDNYIVNYDLKPVKKYTSQGNLIADFNHQELSGDYILRAVDETSNGVGIDYYLLINDTDFASTSSNNNYPLPNRTCRYGIGNVWSLPDSACQNTCPGLTQVVPSDGNVERIISKNNFDDRIGVAITEHKIDATGLSLNTGEYLPVDGVAGVLNRDRIAVKVVEVEKIRNEATLHVIWPALSHQHDVTLILQKDANTYKIIQGNPDAANLPSGNADANNANKPFSAQHYETTSTKDSIILYRRCGASGKWQDPISLCPIAGPAKGGHSSLNSILGFVSASNIEPGSESTKSIENVRAQTYFDFSIPGYDQGLLRQSSLFNMSDAASDFYRLVENAGLTNDITEIPVIPDYRIIGNSLNQFGVSNNGNGVPLGMNRHNIYAYAMCNYNYSNHSLNPVYYNFYNQDFGESSNNGWGTNAKYRCQPGTNNYLNTYKIALYEPTSPGVTPRTTACTQQCNTGIIHRVGRMDQLTTGSNGIDDIFKNSSDSNKDYSTIPANLTKTYFAPDYYQKYAKYYQTPPSGFSLPAGQSDVYQFHQGRCLVGSDPNNCLAPNDNRGFAIFSNYTNNNYLTHGSQNAIFNLISVSGSSDSSNSALINGSYQCKREASSSNYGVTASNGLTLKQRDHDNEPTRANKYCWGLPKTAMIYGMPKATCAPSGKWNLANPFHGKKEKSADIFRYSTVVYHNSNVGQHKINGGIIKEMFFQYGHLRYGNSETLCGTSDTSPLESFCDSTAFLIKENGKYDNSRRFSELGFGKVNDSNICECYNWFFGQHYVSIGDRVSMSGQNMVTLPIGPVDPNLFDELCKTANSNYDSDKKCLGIQINRALDLGNGPDNRHRFIIRSSGMSAGYSNDPAHSRDKDFRIIMWGCPDDLESYDYGKNECKPSSGSTAIYGFNSEVAYGNLPPSCSAFNLATGMRDPINPSVTSVTLYEDTDKKMACADGYDVSLNIGATSPKLTCPTPLPSPPRVTANFSCQEKQCTSQVVAAFCNQESITGEGCQKQLNDGSKFTGTCASSGNNAGELANTIICDKGVVGYDTYDRIKLCGSFCSYTSPTATADGFVFQATPTEIAVSSDLIVRTVAPMSFQCKTGFSLKPDAATSPNINCVANSISYSDARCISNEYCSLKSTIASDINFASTNCNQPGIFCKKVDGAITEILISQGQSVDVSCGGSTVGTKTYSCLSVSSGAPSITLTSQSCVPKQPAGS